METETSKSDQGREDENRSQESKTLFFGANPQHVDVDGIFHFLGHYGKYQMTQIFLTCVFYLALSIPIVHGMFVGKFVDFQCAETGTTFNTSALPPNQTIHFDDCSIEVKDNKTSRVLLKETCTEIEYEGGDKYLSYIAEWDLECGKEILGQLPQVLLIVGQGFGASLITPLGDRFGRSKVIIVGIIAELIVMLASAFVKQFELFLVFRFLIGVFIQAVLVPLCTLMLEIVHVDLKAWVSLLQSMSWVVALVFNGLIGYLLRDVDWRMLQIAYALVGGIPSIIALFFLDESLRWLIRNSKLKESEGILRKACRWNGKDYNTLKDKIEFNTTDGMQELQPMVYKSEESKTDPKKSDSNEKCKPIDIVKNKNTRKITFVMFYTWFITALTFYGIILMSTSLAGDPYVNYFLTAIVEIPAGIVGYYLLKFWDRKPTIIVCNLASAAALLLTVLVTNVAPNLNGFTILQTGLTLVGQFFVIQTFLFVWIYTPELYPTNLRNIGLGIASCAARAGSSFSPLFTILARKVPWAPGALFGGGCLISAFLLTMIPETRQVTLPVTLEDVDNLFIKKTKPSANNDKPIVAL